MQSSNRKLAAAAMIVSVCGTALATGPLRPVALTGTDGPLGPGLGPGITFTNMQLVKTVHPEFGTYIPSAPCMSGSGSVVFGANISGAGIDTSNGSGIWAARGGPALSLVARRGDQIPGQPAGDTYGELFTAPQICDANTVAFQSTIGGPNVTISDDEATYSERSGTMQVLIREGVTAVPDAAIPSPFGGSDPNGDSWGNNQWLLTRNGNMAVRCFVRISSGGWNDQSGTFTDVTGPLTKHYRGGDTWTNGSTTVTFGGATNPRVNDSGAFLTGRLADTTGYGGVLWSNRAKDASGFGTSGTGPLHPIFQSGVTAPGTNSLFNGVFNGYGIFALNSGGRVAFGADLGGGDIGAPGGVWSDARFGVLQLVALSETAAPGVPGEVFNNNSFFAMDLALSDNNVVVLKARLKLSSNVGSGNDIGLWTTRSASTGLPGNLRLAMRESDPVPASAGPDYAGLNFGEPDQFWVNASGRIAFTTLLNDFTKAIWIEQANGVFAPLVKEYTLFDVSGNGSDVRLITTVDAAQSANVVQTSNGTGDGRRSPFSDSGEFSVRLVFADGSEGIFTTAPAIACSGPTVVTPPMSQHVIIGSQVVLNVAKSGTGPIRVQWRHNGTPIAGAFDTTLIINNIQNSDGGAYDVVLTSACGTTTSAAATIVLGQICLPDYNGDGHVTVQDIFDFLNGWFAGDVHADVNGNGLSVSDIFDFLNAWFIGC